MKLPRVKTLVYLAVLMFSVASLSACGGSSSGEQGSEEQQEQQEQQQQQDNQQAEDGQQQQDNNQREPEQASSGDAPDDNGAQNDSARAGGESNNIYNVGEAGEVELRVENGRLALVEARPNQGWDIREVEEESDEVELDFVRGNVRWEFEAELENGEIQVETERDTD